MKQLVLVGILTGALAGFAYAQGTPQQSRPTTGQKQASAVLGAITLPRDVTANGEKLSKGTYVVPLSGEEVTPAPGTWADSERWVEFVQRGQAKGKELASVIPNAEVTNLAEDKQAPPHARQTARAAAEGKQLLSHLDQQEREQLPDSPAARVDLRLSSEVRRPTSYRRVTSDSRTPDIGRRGRPGGRPVRSPSRRTARGGGACPA